MKSPPPLYFFCLINSEYLDCHISWRDGEGVKIPPLLFLSVASPYTFELSYFIMGESISPPPPFFSISDAGWNILKRTNFLRRGGGEWKSPQPNHTTISCTWWQFLYSSCINQRFARLRPYIFMFPSKRNPWTFCINFSKRGEGDFPLLSWLEIAPNLLYFDQYL